MTDTQLRFLRAIADRVGRERISQVELFPSIRQGQIESGVAVVSVEGFEATAVDREVPLGGRSLHADGPAADERPLPESDRDDLEGQPDAPVAKRHDRARHSVLTARYRLAVKGPDRGKWEFEIVHDADAPLDAVERVVRGVAFRLGEEGEPTHLSLVEFLRAVAEI